MSKHHKKKQPAWRPGCYEGISPSQVQAQIGSNCPDCSLTATPGRTSGNTSFFTRCVPLNKWGKPATGANA